jgi:hypothetical protein
MSAQSNSTAASTVTPASTPRPTIWSYSKVKILETCPRLFKANYLTRKQGVDNGIPLVGESIVVGLFIHNIFELCVPDLQKTCNFNIVWSQQLAETRMTTAEEQLANSLKSNVKDMIRLLQTKYLYQELVPERKLEDPDRAVAFIDLEATVYKGKEAGVHLYDYKSAYPTDKALARVTDQLEFYAGMYAKLHPHVGELHGIAGFVPKAEFITCVKFSKPKERAALVDKYEHRVGTADNMLSILKGTKLFLNPKKKTPVCGWCHVSKCPHSKH